MTFRHGHQGGRARAGRLRLVHAQAAHRAPRLRHAHAPVAVRGRPQRVLRGRRGVPALQGRRGCSSPACCSTQPRSPPSPTSGSTPTSGCTAAARRRRTSAGATTTAPRWSGCRCTSRQGPARRRIEVRSLDSACNPYLAFAVLLAAGLKGIEEGYDLPAGCRGRRLGAHRGGAPRAGHRAAAAEPRARPIAVMEHSELVAETLGEHVFDFFLRNKRAEWEDYRAQVTRVRARALPAGSLARRSRTTRRRLRRPSRRSEPLAGRLARLGLRRHGRAERAR